VVKAAASLEAIRSAAVFSTNEAAVWEAISAADGGQPAFIAANPLRPAHEVVAIANRLIAERNVRGVQVSVEVGGVSFTKIGDVGPGQFGR
jgi:hypothetical protein